MPKDVLTFKRGGVHPKDQKQFSKDKKLEKLPIPSLVVVSLSQHLGAPAKPLKKVGDAVLKGEKIGTASSFISAEVHSPVSGVIKKIIKQRLANSVVADAYIIEVDLDAEEIAFERVNYSSKTDEELLATIKDLGIVGLGGATFPSHVKFMIPKGKFVEYLVINGVECEPYLTSDYRTMLERSEEVLEGIMIAKRVSKAKEVIIGIEQNKMDAVEKLRSVIKEKNYPIKVQPLKMKYPQGDEKQLLKATINREIPSGKLPLDIGAVVANIGTCYAIYEAVALNKPLFERVVCVTGECVNEPKNLIVPIGTPISTLIDYCGGFKEDPDKVISGGPMMGFAFADLELPVLKGTSGVICIKENNKAIETACISCGKCVDACPIGLMPTMLYRNIKNGNYQVALDKYSLMDCKECGSCAYVCPAHIPLVHAFKTGKKLARRKK
ncbi:MAG: electron transport complex subunit RsxC [Pleomorphochaeta sp.]